MDVPFRNKLEILASKYLAYLDQRDEAMLKAHLSLDFVRRHQATKQLKLINSLPRLLYGLGMEIHLFDQYDVHKIDGTEVISPFQFEVSYATQVNFFDIEKITITIHSVAVENEDWKIRSIISSVEWEILIKMIENMKEAQ